jgi:hypothetical protein
MSVTHALRPSGYPKTRAPQVPPARAVLFIGLGFLSGLAWGWYLLLLASFYGPVLLLPERLAERGPFLKLMQWTSHVARRFGARVRVEHAAIDVFNGRMVGVRNRI